MSTEFRTVTTDEWVGVRYCGKDGVSFDVGCGEGRSETVRTCGVDTGDDVFVVDEYGRTYTGVEFVTEVFDVCTVTRGVFGGTFEVGSGDYSTFVGL